MRVGFVRNVGLAALGLAVAALAACNDDPLSFDTDKTYDLFVNPTSMVVPAGRVGKLESRAVNEGLEPTFAAVEQSVSPACVTVDVDPDALPIQPPGLFIVTGGNGLGGCTITLTSAGITKEVAVIVVAGGIEILDPPASVNYLGTVQLNARLVTSGDEISEVTPFENSDATWTSDEPDIASVDENGLVTGLAAGVAVIEACWTGTEATGTGGLGVEVCDETAIEVVVAPPTLNDLQPPAGLVGEVVTITLDGLLDVHNVYIDGVQLNSIYIESFDTEAGEIVFWWPFNGVGVHGVTVGTVTAQTDPISFELTSEGSADDPDYLDPGTAPLQALPFKKVGYLTPDILDHFYRIELAAQTAFDVHMDWDSGADFDILFTDGDFTGYVCNFGAATGNQPEATSCDLPAGAYLIWVNNYDGQPGTYVLEATPQ